MALDGVDHVSSDSSKWNNSRLRCINVRVTLRYIYPEGISLDIRCCVEENDKSRIIMFFLKNIIFFK